MKIWIAATLAALISLPVLAVDTGAVRVEPIDFTTSADSVERKQSIKGDQTAEYRFNARAGQMLTVDFKPSNPSAYFNITAKGADYALFNGSIMGNHFSGSLPSDGEYTVQVYLMRNAARRNEVANYALSLRLAAADAVDGTKPFDQTLELQGIRFHVSREQVDGQSVLRIEPKGLEIDNSAITRPLKGEIVRAEIGDLNNDGSPEIYVFTRISGRGMPGDVIAYSANNKKSLSEIYLPPVSDNPKSPRAIRARIRLQWWKTRWCSASRCTTALTQAQAVRGRCARFNTPWWRAKPGGFCAKKRWRNIELRHRTLASG